MPVTGVQTCALPIYPRRSPVWPVFLAAAAVLLFVGLIVYFLWNTLFAGMLAPAKTYPVPNLTGKIYEEIMLSGQNNKKNSTLNRINR